VKQKIKEPKQFIDRTADIAKKSSNMGSKTYSSLDYKDLVSVNKHNNSMDNTVNNIKELFPDIGLAIEIVTSLIHSPNNINNGNLNYKLDKFDLPTSVQSNIVTTISDYIESTYKINDKIDNIIEESLFTKGSYVEINIPPKNISDILRNIKKETTAGVLIVT